MSRKKVRKSNYYLFERKMMQKMFTLILASIGMIFLFRELIRGHFGEAVVTFLASKFRLEYQDALYIYETTFRENLDMIMCVTIIIALIFVFHYSIGWVNAKMFWKNGSGTPARPSSAKMIWWSIWLTISARL